MNKIPVIFSLIIFLFLNAYSQKQELNSHEKLKNDTNIHDENILKLLNLKISGYIQPQFQWGEQSASLKVGTGNTDASGNSITAPYSRIGIRRGRLKFAYNNGGIASGSFQLNIIEKPGLSGATVQLKDAYLTATDPWMHTNRIRFGVFERPFGFETGYSSSLIESPERSRFTSTLFPEECDLGAMIILQAPSNSDFHFLKFEGGMFAGNAINPETDNKKDFIGHLIATHQTNTKFKWSLGVSYYNGGVYQTNNVVMDMQGNSFLKNENNSNQGKFAKREYFGVDGQFCLKTLAGNTQLRAEYVAGTQPGNSKSSNSPNRSTLPPPEDTFVRPISGWYAVIIHDLNFVPLSGIVKYDVYDPNTNVKGNDIGTPGSYTCNTDIAFSTLGIGIIWHITQNLQSQIYYEFVKNETSTLLNNTNILKDYSKDLKDNVFTARIQFRF